MNKMHRINDITIDESSHGTGNIFVVQDRDTILVKYEDIEAFANAAKEYAHPTIEKPDPAPEKWYVVLKNSNIRLTNLPNVPTVFTTYSAAKIYARECGGLERTYCPITADEYELAFGR